MSLFGLWRDLGNFQTIADILRYFHVDQNVWDGFSVQVGDFNDDIRLLAAFPRTGVVTGASQTMVWTRFGSIQATPVQATQLGLVWRLARRVAASQAGVPEEDFVDIDPWQASTGPSTPTAPSRPASSTASVKEKVLKMSSLIDQSDDSELLPPSNTQVNVWLQNYLAIMGNVPEEAEEPTANQLAALHKRVVTDGAAPYVDMGVWGPYERKLSKTHKCRVITPLGDGSFWQRDLPGPASYQAWLAAWRVFRAAALMLNIASMSSLEIYQRFIERLVTQWPQNWGLIYAAEDAARAERFEKLRRHYTLESAFNRQVPRDWDPSRPWSCIFVQMTKEDSYWAEKVHIPASAWTAAGCKGTPIVATEAAVKSVVPGLNETEFQETAGGDGSRRQVARERRQAKKRRIQQDREELKQLKSQHGGGKVSQGGSTGSSTNPKGRNKGKSKDQSGTPICFSWASGTGPCGKLPPGAECVGAIKRAHKCRKCLSPSHQDDQCTAWKGKLQWAQTVIVLNRFSSSRLFPTLFTGPATPFALAVKQFVQC